jgi:hypothetical protein
MMEDVRITTEEAASPAADDVKSRILARISKEVEKGKGDKSNQFQIVTGDPKTGQNPVMDTYYKGGSYVKTS